MHVVDATAEPVPAYQFDDKTKMMTLAFSDLYLVSTEGGDVFALNLNEWDHPPPFYLDIEGRVFAMQPSNTYLVTGYGAGLPEFIQSEEAEGRLTVVVEREERYLAYSHDTAAVDEDDEKEASAAEDDNASEDESAD
jgi:hypothetical protein